MVVTCCDESAANRRKNNQVFLTQTCGDPSLEPSAGPSHEKACRTTPAALYPLFEALSV